MVEDNNQYWYGLIEGAILGSEKDVKLNLTSECSSCHGKGGFNEKKCHTCGGAGKVLEQAQTIFGYMQTQKTCPDCRGTGKSFENVCDVCHGKGIVDKTKTLTVTIPEGVDEGYQLRLAGKGIKLPNSITKGNMYAVINIITPTKLDRKQKSLLQDLAKTYLEDSVEFKNFKKYLK